MSTEYLNMTDSAEFLNISRRYLYRLIERNQIDEPIEIAPHVKVYDKGYLKAVKESRK